MADTTTTQFIEVMLLKAHGVSVLTYQANAEVEPGQIVKVPLGQRQTFGVISKLVPKPAFKTKQISQLISLPPLPSAALPVINWMKSYYAADISDVLRLFLPPRPDILTPLKTAVSETVKVGSSPNATQGYKLNKQQQNVIRTIMDTSERQWLLHGVTGSGKTAVYIAICKKLLKADKSVVVLVPEIALATQVIHQFRQALGPDVIVTHSHMSARERRAIWQYSLTTKQPLVVIGPRSALFTPVKNLGAIIIDECHESSYKQEQSPYYHAREVASRLIDQVDGKLILGSATPGSQDIFLQKQKRLRLISLPDPIHSNSREVTIVDMKGQKSIFSPELKSAISETLQQKKQALLFINRRGSASQVLCATCGWVAKCPNCDIPQTWHGGSGKLRCHWCGTHAKLPGSCPDCHSLHWRFLGIGTQRIESEVRSRFPHASVLRLDKDSFSAKTIGETMLSLKRGDIDILIGTQMIAKGLDFPNVNLVGVVLADTMLHIPDMSSNERTYQLLHQIIGRAGRSSNLPSRAIIQTYNPDHHAITAAAKHDFDGFMATELIDRQELGYPPYRYLLKLTCKRKTRNGAKAAAERLSDLLDKRYHDQITVRGPAPAWREQLGEHFYWHLIVTAAKRQPLTEIITSLPPNWQADIDPTDLL